MALALLLLGLAMSERLHLHQLTRTSVVLTLALASAAAATPGPPAPRSGLVALWRAGARSTPGAKRTATSPRAAQPWSERLRQNLGALGARARVATSSTTAGSTPLPAGDQFDAPKELRALQAAFKESNPWSRIRELTTPEKIAEVHAYAETINPEKADEITVRFFREVYRARTEQPESVRKLIAALPKDWFQRSPVYYFYVQHTGTRAQNQGATFDDMVKMLDHLDNKRTVWNTTLSKITRKTPGIGVKLLYLLPEKESPMADGGYDVSDFNKVRDALGGNAGMERFMKEAVKRGFLVMNDMVANHVSDQHPWFQDFLAGNESLASRFVLMDGTTKIGEKEIDGRTFSVLKHPDGKVSYSWRIFPFASTDNLRKVSVGGVPHQVYHSFYPFQIDTNEHDPAVLEAQWRSMGREANLGIVGKRMDAAPHFDKKEGTTFEGTPADHAILALFKSFERHVVPDRGITIPEVGFGAQEAVKYFGKDNSEGDAVFAFETQAAMRASLFTGKAKYFWQTVNNLPPLPPGGTWYNFLGHHDELRIDLMPKEVQDQVREYLRARGAKDFAGRGVGGRMADFLDRDPRRIANAYFMLAMAPGNYVVYAGDEIGATHNPDFMEAEQKKRYEIQKRTGIDRGMEGALDTRDLNRGPLLRKAFETARRSGYAPVVTLRALTSLRAARPSLFRSNVSEMKTDEEGVFSMVRSAPGEDAPLLALSNLTAQPKTVHLRIDDLERQLGWRANDLGRGGLVDILATEIARKPALASAAIRDGQLELTLKPFEYVLLDKAHAQAERR